MTDSKEILARLEEIEREEEEIDVGMKYDEWVDREMQEEIVQETV